MSTWSPVGSRAQWPGHRSALQPLGLLKATPTRSSFPPGADGGGVQAEDAEGGPQQQGPREGAGVQGSKTTAALPAPGAAGGAAGVSPQSSLSLQPQLGLWQQQGWWPGSGWWQQANSLGRLVRPGAGKRLGGTGWGPTVWRSASSKAPEQGPIALQGAGIRGRWENTRYCLHSVCKSEIIPK